MKYRTPCRGLCGVLALLLLALFCLTGCQRPKKETEPINFGFRCLASFHTQSAQEDPGDHRGGLSYGGKEAMELFLDLQQTWEISGEAGESHFYSGMQYIYIKFMDGVRMDDSTGMADETQIAEGRKYGVYIIYETELISYANLMDDPQAISTYRRMPEGSYQRIVEWLAKDIKYG